MEKIQVKVLVACCNAAGEPTLYPVLVHCALEQYDNGDHYEAAKEEAGFHGYEMVVLAIDENDDVPPELWELYDFGPDGFGSEIDISGEA